MAQQRKIVDSLLLLQVEEEDEGEEEEEACAPYVNIMKRTTCSSVLLIGLQWLIDLYAVVH